MHDKGRTRVGLPIYVGTLAALWLVLLAYTFFLGNEWQGEVWVFLVFAVYLAITEYSDLNFHDERARLGLAASEAIFLPMVVALSFEHLLWGVSLAVFLREFRRFFTLKGLFNVAQYGIAGAAAAGIWASFSDSGASFSARDAIVAVLAVLVVSMLTHSLTTIAIAISEGGSVIALSRAALPATLRSTAGSIVLGLLFAASYASAPWTIVLFPLVIAVFFAGHRAMLSQRTERERVESLHAASRALASSPDVERGILGFLEAVGRMVSANEMRAVVQMRDEAVWTGIRAGSTIASMKPLAEGPLAELFRRVRSSGGAVYIDEDSSLDDRSLCESLGVRNLVAVLLSDEHEVPGCLVAMDRVGAGEFGESTVRLLEALSNELALSLGSYRLFASIAEERERFGRIFSSSQEGICLLDADGVVRAWNPALEKISGHYAADLMDKMWSDRVLIRDREQRRVTKLDLVGIRPAEEVELVTKEGPSRWITVVSGPVGETEGGGWVVLVRDVTAAHEVEVAKSDFLSTISHELRTPLTTIKGSLQVLGRGRDNIPENIADQMIDVTTRGAERLERLVMNLLAVSQIESGSIAVFPDEISLEDLVSERYEASLKDHPRSRLILPENPIGVRADRERLEQAVEHVLENAAKFGGPDGEIEVRISHHNGYARLSVSDEGPGIATSDQERIFERFVRLGEVLTRETQGAGIGLFIAKTAMEAMGGRIWVESTPGEGATFHLEVPLARPMALAGEGSA